LVVVEVVVVATTTVLPSENFVVFKMKTHSEGIVTKIIIEAPAIRIADEVVNADIEGEKCSRQSLRYNTILVLGRRNLEHVGVISEPSISGSYQIIIYCPSARVIRKVIALVDHIPRYCAVSIERHHLSVSHNTGENSKYR